MTAITTKILKDPKLAQCIENEDFYPVYQQLVMLERAVFTKECLEAGINPLDYMDVLPSYYCSGEGSVKGSFLILSHIRKIETQALLFAPIQTIQFQGTVADFNRINKQPQWMPSYLTEVLCSDGVWYALPKGVSVEGCPVASGSWKISGQCPQVTVGDYSNLQEIVGSSAGDIFCDKDAKQFYCFTGSHWIPIWNVSLTQSPTKVQASDGRFYTCGISCDFEGQVSY